MIRDRGKIKWTSMMLPEHVKMLRDWEKEDTYEEQIALDEQQLEEMNMVMGEAMETGRTVTITHYGKHRYELLIGTIHYYNENGQKLHIVDRFQQAHIIGISHIADIRFT